MKRVLTLLALLSVPALTYTSSRQGEFLAEDRSELARLSAELRAEEQQLNRSQQKIAQLRERICRHESAAHVRSAESVKKSYKGSTSGYKNSANEESDEE